MNVRAFTAQLAARCLDVGIQCRYEHFADRWRWNFYRNGVRVASKLDPEAALKFLVDLETKTD